MRFLLDTVVLSEARKLRRDTNVARWLESIKRDALFVSVASIVEIQRGIDLAERKDPAFARVLARWIAAIIESYAENLLPVDLAIARRWGALSAALGHRELDLAIAATALEHGMAVATRNTDDFLRTGAPVVNPFDPSPEVLRPRARH